MATRLPNELLLQILEQVSKHDIVQRRRDLKSLRLVSPLFRDIVTPELFSTIHLRGCLEDSTEHLRGLANAPKLVEHIRKIIILDSAIFAFDRGVYMKAEKALMGDVDDTEQKAMTDNIIARYFAGDVAGNELNSRMLIDARTSLMFSTFFTLGFWPLVSLCSENLTSLRLLHKQGYEDADFFAMIIFNTLEKFRLPKLHTLEIQMYDLFNLRNLAHLIPNRREQYGESITVLERAFDRYRYRWNMTTIKSNFAQFRNVSLTSLKGYPSAHAFWRDPGIFKIGRKLFGDIKSIENLSLDGFGGLFVFRHIPYKYKDGSQSLTSFTLANCPEVYGGELKDILYYSLCRSLRSLTLENISIQLPGAEEMYMFINRIPLGVPEYPVVPWFEIFEQCTKYLQQLQYISFKGLGYYLPQVRRGRDDLKVTEYKIYSESEPAEERSYVLESMYAEDYKALLEVRDAVMKKRKEMEGGDSRVDKKEEKDAFVERYWHSTAGWV